MADLLALQPNMKIKLHIVAPPAKRDKVFQEIRRPVFSLLESGTGEESELNSRLFAPLRVTPTTFHTVSIPSGRVR